jgi:hypothetical protein
MNHGSRRYRPTGGDLRAVVTSSDLVVPKWAHLHLGSNRAHAAEEALLLTFSRTL